MTTGSCRSIICDSVANIAGGVREDKHHHMDLEDLTMKRRKLLAGILTAVLAFGCLTGCGNLSDGRSEFAAANATEGQTKGGEKGAPADTATDKAGEDTTGKTLKIVTTIFPEYDWVKNILGENADHAELTLLLDDGADLHSYQPTVEDMAKIKECDLFIYVGGTSDAWVKDVLGSGEAPASLNLLEVLGDQVKNEEIVEGMEHEHEEGDHAHEEDKDGHDGDDQDKDSHDGDDQDKDSHDGDDQDKDGHDGDDHDHEHEEEKDEHVWLSLRNATVLCGKIAEKLGEIDAEHKDLYMKNYQNYKAGLEKLDGEYKAAVDAGKTKTLLFGDRFPFRYLVDDYGLGYYAAFTGCSAESEASFETIIFLAGKVDELGLHAIMTLEGTNHKLAETVRDNTASRDQKLLSVNSMQSTTSADIANGATYLSIMQGNLDVLKEALQ